MNLLIKDRNFSSILSITSWGFIFPITILLFGYAGMFIDTYFNIQPMFMLGLFTLGVILCSYRFYIEVFTKNNKLFNR